MTEAPRVESRFVWTPISFKRWWHLFTLTPVPALVSLVFIASIVISLLLRMPPRASWGLQGVLARDHARRRHLYPEYAKMGLFWSDRPGTASWVSRALAVLFYGLYLGAALGMAGFALSADWLIAAVCLLVALASLLIARQFYFSPLFRYRRWWLPPGIRPAWAVQARSMSPSTEKPKNNRRQHAKRPFRRPLRHPPFR